MAFDVSHLFSGLIGGLLTAGANYLALRWRYRTDELAAFWTKTCDDVAAAADLAAEYWLKDLSIALTEDALRAIKADELRIIGHQARLTEMLAILDLEASKIDLLSLKPTFVDFFDALSGGDFQVEDRRADFERARAVQYLGANLVVQLRKALRRRTRLW